MARQAYPHQIEGIRLMMGKDRGLLCDEMGLGKTYQSTAYLRILEKIYQPTGHMLIVCPLAVLQNWENEVRVVAGVRKAHIYHGSSAHMPTEDSIIITTFGMVKHLPLSYAAVIIDEIHVARNPRSKMFKSLCDLRSPHVWGLSGTPFNNRSTDLYAISVIIKMGEPYTTRKWWSKVTPEKMDSWRDQFVIRRLKADVLTLPTMTQRFHTVDPTDEEWLTIDGLHRDTRRTFFQRERATTVEEHRDLAMVLIQLITRLRLASDSITTIPDEEGVLDLQCDDPEGLYNNHAKIKAVTDALESSEGKVVVFSNFTRTLEILETVWRYRNPTEACVKYTGGMTNRQREVALSEFRSTAKVLFISEASGNVGLTLNEASTVYFVEPAFNPFAEQQAMERVHRIGQTNPVEVVHFRLRAPADQWMDSIRMAKREFGDALLGEGVGGMGFSLTEVRKLLQLIKDYAVTADQMRPVVEGRLKICGKRGREEEEGAAINPPKRVEVV